MVEGGEGFAQKKNRHGQNWNIVRVKVEKPVVTQEPESPDSAYSSL